MLNSNLNLSTLPESTFTYQFVNGALLFPCMEYQRLLRTEKVASIAENFSEYIANDPKVSFRDGRYYVFDGQNTVEARRTCNGGKDVTIRCKVFYGLTKEDEATLFALQTGISTCLTAGERLRANLVAENPDALYFVGITSNAGVEFAYDGIRAPWKIYCIETAYELYKQYGCERLRRDASHHQRGVEGQCGCLPCRCNPGCGPLHLRIRGRVQPGAAGAAAGKDTSENHHAAGTERHRQFCKPPHAADSPHL